MTANEKSLLKELKELVELMELGFGSEYKPIQKAKRLIKKIESKQ